MDSIPLNSLSQFNDCSSLSHARCNIACCLLLILTQEIIWITLFLLNNLVFGAHFDSAVITDVWVSLRKEALPRSNSFGIQLTKKHFSYLLLSSFLLAPKLFRVRQLQISAHEHFTFVVENCLFVLKEQTLASIFNTEYYWFSTRSCFLLNLRAQMI